jgi:site-specific DNA recombinase
MTRSVVYAAKSTADERGSILAQIEECRVHGARKGWEHDLHDEYTDESASAFTGSRGPGLRAAIQRATDLTAMGEDVVLLVFATDRLARGDGRGGAAHLVEYFLNALKAGYRIESVTEDVSGAMALTLAALYGDRAHADSAAKSAHTRAGKRRAAEQGRRNGGPRPYGYRHVAVIGTDGKPTSRVEVVPAEAATLRRMFEEYLDGRTQAEIARGLNADGITTVRGKRWNQSQVSGHLRNRVYLGQVRNRDEWFAAQHQPIVDRVTFENVQGLLAASKRRGHGGGRPVVGSHLLTHGLLRCSCGASMRPRTDRKGYGQWEAYLCNGRHAGETTCTRSAVARAPVDAAIWRYIEDVAVDHDAMVEDARRLSELRLVEVDAQIAEATRELARATDAYDRVRGDYAEGRIPPEAWIEMRSDLQSARDAADAASNRLSAHREAIARDISTEAAEADVLERIAEIREALAGVAGGASSLAVAREALRSVFEAFILHDDHHPPPLFDGDLASPGQGWIIEPVPRADAVLAPRVIAEVGGERHITQKEVLRQARIANGRQHTDSQR